MEIRAGVRNPDKPDKLKSLSGVAVLQATMGDRESLKQTLKGVDALFIVTPVAENCDQLTISTAEVAKEVGVKHIMVVSLHITLAENISDTILGVPYAAVEEAITKLGVPFTILRLPDFTDNLWRQKLHAPQPRDQALSIPSEARFLLGLSRDRMASAHTFRVASKRSFLLVRES